MVLRKTTGSLCERVTVNSKKKRRRCLQTVEIATSYLRLGGTLDFSKRTMNYILVRSIAVPGQGHEGVNLPGPTYIEYYAERNTVTLLEAELKHTLEAKCPSPTVRSSQGFYYNYTTENPPLVVLEFFKQRRQHGYRIAKRDIIGDTYIWTLEKPFGTDQSTQTTEQST